MIKIGDKVKWICGKEGIITELLTDENLIVVKFINKDGGINEQRWYPDSLGLDDID
jgi:hypothetical protein